jgi:hypothetical protein
MPQGNNGLRPINETIYLQIFFVNRNSMNILCKYAHIKRTQREIAGSLIVTAKSMESRSLLATCRDSGGRGTFRRIAIFS